MAQRHLSSSSSFFLLFFYLPLMFCSSAVAGAAPSYASAVGDPGMRADGLRVAFEGWNFCNEVGSEAPNMGSPRAADCFDLSPGPSSSTTAVLNQRVTEQDNKLGVGTPIPGFPPSALNDTDLYAVQKELYLGSLCEVRPDDGQSPWQFWMVMLKNGNFDASSGLCPKNGEKSVGGPPPAPTGFPCFGKGCMNQPLLFHRPTNLSGAGEMVGGFWGTYDLNSPSAGSGGVVGGGDNESYFEVVWKKEVGAGSWVFHHKLQTSSRYPWLMLYLRADATRGLSGGYPYETRGMLRVLPESPNFKVTLTLDVKQGGGNRSQFYLLDIGGCWKNSGDPCDGDVTTDVTRYSEMIINPSTPPWCSSSTLQNCPPYHVSPDQGKRKISRNDTAEFPYAAYHYYCAPGNSEHLERPYSLCDPYSNPQAQEIVQILPHPAWEPYGYPSVPGQGWVGDPRTWELDTGALSANLYFYQDPGTAPARRIWTSVDTGTEIFLSAQNEVAEWTLSDFDVLLTN